MHISLKGYVNYISLVLGYISLNLFSFFHFIENALFLVTFIKLVQFIGRKRAELLSMFYRTTLITGWRVECLELALMP